MCDWWSERGAGEKLLRLMLRALFAAPEPDGGFELGEPCVRWWVHDAEARARKEVVRSSGEGG